jgi:hypothetical protein
LIQFLRGKRAAHPIENLAALVGILRIAFGNNTIRLLLDFCDFLFPDVPSDHGASAQRECLSKRSRNFSHCRAHSYAARLNDLGGDWCATGDELMIGRTPFNLAKHNMLFLLSHAKNLGFRATLHETLGPSLT